jgi:hypothetical protein
MKRVRSGKFLEPAMKTSIGDVAKFQQLKYFCPYCRDEVDKRAVLAILNGTIDPTNSPYQPVKSDPVILNDEMIFCCSECFLISIRSLKTTDTNHGD